MQSKYRYPLVQFPIHIAAQIASDLLGENQFNGSLYDTLHEAGFGQADIVLCLLRRNTAEARSAAELLIGKPIQVIPCVRKYKPAPKYVPGPDDRKVLTVVKHNPRLPTTPSFYRFNFFRPGITIESLLRRGVTRRDITEAERNNWVSFG